MIGNDELMLVGMEMVKELVETVILTGRLTHDAPVSLLLISYPEAGKTRVFFETPCAAVVPLNDVTGRALQQLCQLQPEKTHFLINDLVAVAAHKPSVNKYTMAMINAMIEEGIQAVAFPGSIETFKNGRRGIIAAITTDLMGDGRHWWHKIGLTSRMLPFCYTHSGALIVRIKEAISRTKDGLDSHEFAVPSVAMDVAILEPQRRALLSIADTVAKNLGEVGFRRLKQFRALIRAHALHRSWKEPRVVTDEDIDFLKRIAPYISYTQGHFI